MKRPEKGGGARAAEDQHHGHDRGREQGEQLAAELPVAKHHAADIFEAGAGGLSASPASRQAGDGGGQRGAARQARGSARCAVHDGGNADQIIAGERAETEDDAQHGDRAEGDRDGPKHPWIVGQSKGYVHRFEDASEIAGYHDEEQGCGFSDLPDGFQARRGDEANQPAEEGATE